MAKELVINRRFGSLAEAQNAARLELHRHNRNQITGSVSLMGDPALAAGLNVNLEDVGRLNGKYHIDSVQHEYSPEGGYVCTLSIRMGAPDGIVPKRVKSATGRTKTAAVVPPVTAANIYRGKTHEPG